MAYHPYHQPQFPPMFHQQQRSSAPFSVHVVAFFIYLGGVLVLLGALAVGALGLGATQLQAEDLPEGAGAALAGVGLIVAVVLLLLSVLYFLIARKLQRGRQWARVLVLIFCGLGILGTALQLFTLFQMDADPVMLGAAGSSLIGPVLFIILLNTSAARSWFSYRTY